jgi:ESF2/ABP1 family protein
MSEESDSHYNSEQEQQQFHSKFRESRLKQKEFDSSDDGDSNNVDKDSIGEVAGEVAGEDSEFEDFNSDTERENIEALKADIKPLDAEKLAKFQEKIAKSGVCYMSRIPPFMKHTKLRSMLSTYGVIGRIYLNPEDPKIAARRKKYKKNKRQNFVEGWIEFTDKKVARQVAELLNNNNMGGKKRSRYYDDIWNIKYLPKFKWSHLTDQLAYERKVKEQKLRAEMSQAKRENQEYLQNVEKAKMIEAITEKKKKRGQEMENQVKRQYKQRKVQQEPKKASLRTNIFTN